MLKLFLYLKVGGGDREDPNCHRPISLLPTISKILEKLLATRLIKFLTIYKILSKDQFGFRAKFSTEYAIVDIYDKLIKNIDEKKNHPVQYFWIWQKLLTL